MKLTPEDSSILCVDREKEVLKLYEETFSKHSVFMASNGEDALEIVRREVAAGRHIHVGFIDIGFQLDGSGLITEILKTDRLMLCAAVADPFIIPDQFAHVFEDAGNWMYVARPLSAGGILQTAHHLLSLWRRRRQEERLANSVTLSRGILESVSLLNQAPPLALDRLLEKMLFSFLKLSASQDGFIALVIGSGIRLYHGNGAFQDHHGHSIQDLPQWDLVEAVLEKKTPVIDKNRVGIPLVAGDEALGLVFLGGAGGVCEDLVLLEMYAKQATNLIQHSKLYDELECRNLEFIQKNVELLDLLGKLTQTEKLKEEFERLSCIDGLTGIPNRRHLETRIQEELAWARRHAALLAFIIFDIDHFKAINDTYGHAAGDYVLKELGRLLVDNKRGYDVVGRYGGEEFIMILKQIPQPDATAVCERLRSAVQNHSFLFQGERVKITLSIGITVLVPSQQDSAESILRKADEALYKAKQNGRNRWVCII